MQITGGIPPRSALTIKRSTTPGLSCGSPAETTMTAWSTLAAMTCSLRAAWRDRLLPALDAFAPELLVISAGFDAHARDPLAQLRVREGDFGWLTTELCRLSDRHCGGKVVSLLEGGYDLDALAASTATHVRALMQS